MRGIKKIISKVKEEDLQKIDSTIKEIKKCARFKNNPVFGSQWRF